MSVPVMFSVGVDQGTKTFNVDVVSESKTYLMTFAIPVPGLRLDHYEIDWQSLYSEGDLVDVDLEGLASGLEFMPCCVSDKSQENTGDPLNIAIVGSIDDVYYAFMRAGWNKRKQYMAVRYGERSIPRCSGVSTVIHRLVPCMFSDDPRM